MEGTTSFSSSFLDWLEKAPDVDREPGDEVVTVESVLLRQTLLRADWETLRMSLCVKRGAPPPDEEDDSARFSLRDLTSFTPVGRGAGWFSND